MKYRNEARLDIFKLKNVKVNWKKIVLFKPRQNCRSRGSCYILSTDIIAKWWFCFVVMMVEVHDVRWGGVNGLPFWSLVSSSEAATSDMPIFWVWVMRNQWLWAHLSLSILRESRESSIKHQFSQNSLTHLRRGPIAVWLRDGDGGDGGEADWVMLVMTCTENQCVPDCGKSVCGENHVLLYT